MVDEATRSPGTIMRKILLALNKIEEWTLVMLLLGLAFLSFIEVFCRYLLGFSFTWMEELSRFSAVFAAFLGASLGVKYGMHFSMDLVHERVKSDRFRHGLRFATGLLSALVFLIVAYYGWEVAMKHRASQTLTSAMKIPKYWVYLPIPFFSAIISLRFLNLCGKHLKGLVRGAPFSLKGQ
jgi:C4-dicarboxylate transporter DctQ subunit